MKKVFSLLLVLGIVLGTACENKAVEQSQEGVSDESKSIVSEETEALEVVIDTPTDYTKIISDMKVGWNLGNTLDAYSSGVPSETAWGNKVVTAEFMKKVSEAGFGTVRIPVSYLKKIGEGPDYKVDEAWLNRVSEIVDYTLDTGMYAIINIHHDGNHDGAAWIDVTEDDQTEIRARFEAVWTQIAEHFKDYGYKLVFESMNEILEPNNYSANINENIYENINTLNQIFVDTVRSSGSRNAERWLLVPGYNTNIDATRVEAGFVLPNDTVEKKLMVSVHYYDPYDICLNESKKNFKWGNDAAKPFKSSWGNEDHADAQMAKLLDEFTSKGIPVILGEYGIIDKTWVDENSTEYRRYYLEYVTKAAISNGVLPVYWDNGYNGKNGLALFNRSTGDIIFPTLVEAIMRGVTGGDYEIATPDVPDWGL